MSISAARTASRARTADSVLLALSRHAIRHTPVRQAVLEVLLQSSFALSGAEIEKQIPTIADRITLYRTLRTFEEKSLFTASSMIQKPCATPCALIHPLRQSSPIMCILNAQPADTSTA